MMMPNDYDKEWPWHRDLPDVSCSGFCFDVIVVVNADGQTDML